MKYSKPKITNTTILQLENEILVASIVVDDDYSIEIVGQEVEEIPWDSFTNKWR